jgi:hypothetical protein
MLGLRLKPQRLALYLMVAVATATISQAIISNSNLDKVKYSLLTECHSGSCQVNKDSLTKIRSSKPLDLNLELSLNSAEVKKGWKLLGPNAIRIENSRDHHLMLVLPVSFGIPNGSFDVPLPANLPLYNIHLELEGSRVFRLSLNGQAIALMRYNEPVYGIGNIVITPTNVGTGRITFRKTPTKYFEPIWLLILLMGSIGGLSYSGILKLLSKFGFSSAYKRDAQGRIESVGIGIAIVVLLYLASFARWLIVHKPTADVIDWASDTPFTQAGPRFSDFYQLLLTARLHHPYSGLQLNYPPGALAVLKFFAVFPNEIAFSIFVGLTLGVLFACTIAFPLIPKSLTVLSFISFPLMFGLDRGNLDILVIALLLFTFMLPTNYGTWAGAIVGLCSAIKMWPILLILPLFQQNRSNKTLVGFSISFLSLTGLGMALYGGNVFAPLINDSYTQSSAGFTHNVSLRGFVSLVGTGIFGGGFSRADQIGNSLVVTVFRALLGIALLIASWKLKLLHQKLLGIALFILLIPSTTYLYRVEILVLPFLFWAAYTRMGTSMGAYEKLKILIFAVALSPTAFWYKAGSAVGTDSVIIPAALLLLASTLILDKYWARNLQGGPQIMAHRPTVSRTK